MKKSRRKDVIVARIIFALMCVLLLVIIAGAVVLVRERLGEKKSTQSSQSESESENSEDTQAALPVVTPEPSQAPEPKLIMRTTTGVRLRKEPNTDCEILTVLVEDTKLEIINSENGWAFVDYQGQTGYVSMDYLEEVTGTD